MVHHWDIPGTNYSPDVPIRLFSPQHWAQVNKNKDAHSDTNADRITLEWKGHIRTVPLNAANVGFLRSASGYRKSNRVMAALGVALPDELTCFQAHLIPPDDEEYLPAHSDSISLDSNEPTQVSEGADSLDSDSPNNFDMDELTMMEDDELQDQDLRHSKDATATLPLHWHYHFGHLSFKTLQAMAAAKILPPSLAKCKVPQYAA
jgi:hypothetical protein